LNSRGHRWRWQTIKLLPCFEARGLSAGVHGGSSEYRHHKTSSLAHYCRRRNLSLTLVVDLTNPDCNKRPDNLKDCNNRIAGLRGNTKSSVNCHFLVPFRRWAIRGNGNNRMLTSVSAYLIIATVLPFTAHSLLHLLHLLELTALPPYSAVSYGCDGTVQATGYLSTSDLLVLDSTVASGFDSLKQCLLTLLSQL
jgi:hypothetical protein